jgi:hypothetical protein
MLQQGWQPAFTTADELSFCTFCIVRQARSQSGSATDLAGVLGKQYNYSIIV